MRTNLYESCKIVKKFLGLLSVEQPQPVEVCLHNMQC